MPATADGIRELGMLYGEAVATLAAIAALEPRSIGDYMRLGQEAQRQAREFMRKWEASPHTPKLPPGE